MKRVLILLLALLAVGTSKAQQSWEIGPMVGVTYYNGDMNEYGHFHPDLTHLAYGLMVRNNLSSRWSMKYSALLGNISGNDQYFDNFFQQQRNLSFTSRIYEASAQFEFNFFKYVGSDKSSYFTPTVFVGWGFFWFNPKATNPETGVVEELQYQRNENQARQYRRFQPALPFGIGFRAKFNHRILLSAEWGLRRTWTDYLDDVSTSYPIENNAYTINGNVTNPGFQRGNSKTKDWYSFAGLVVTYRFGHKPNDCHFHKINKRNNKRFMLNKLFQNRYKPSKNKPNRNQ